MKHEVLDGNEAQAPELAEATHELVAAADGQGYPAREDAVGKLVEWAQLVTAWRARAGLTAARTTDAVIRELMVPAVYALRFVANAQSVLDLGCGSGCTGVTLALLLGQGRWDLVDRSETKITFCRYALDRCGIPRVRAHARGEALEKELRGDIVLARALPRTEDTVEDVKRFASPGAPVVRWVDVVPAGTRRETIRCGSRELWIVVESVERFT